MSGYKCPACGAALRISGDGGEAVCEYCGCRTDIQPRQRKSYQGKTKYCRHCGERIPEKAVVCPDCGCQVEELKYTAPPSSEPRVVINRHIHYENHRPAYETRRSGKMRRKWVAFTWCILLGWLGAHKFYEGKYFWGVVYLLTGSFGGIGWLVDCIVLLFKPDPYYV